jgi:integrase
VYKYPRFRPFSGSVFPFHSIQVGGSAANIVATAHPRVKRREFAIYSEEQARRLLDAVAGHRLEALLVLALTTGMREGELDTLQWRDVDLEGGSLQVRRTLQRTAEGYRWDDTKTAHSRRRIALPALAIAALRRHRARQAQERLRLGPAWQDNDLVFTEAGGGRLSLYYFYTNGWYGSVVKRAGLPTTRFRDLRHTAATLLLERGVNPKVVSEMLGHSSVAVTLTLYGHVTPHMQHEAAATMERTLGDLGNRREQTGELGSNQGSTDDLSGTERG